MFSRLSQITLLALGLTISNHANAAPLTYGTYYDESASAVCVNATSCRLNFSQLPSDKLLMVQKINCTTVSSQPIAYAFFQISATSGGSALSRNLPIALPLAQLISGSYSTSWETNTHFLVGTGRFPYISLFGNGAVTSTPVAP
jgi:hypothetical protein